MCAQGQQVLIPSDEHMNISSITDPQQIIVVDITRSLRHFLWFRDISTIGAKYRDEHGQFIVVEVLVKATTRTYIRDLQRAFQM